jgi:hypothetical protein
MAKERFISFAALIFHIEALQAAISAGDAAAVRAKLQELTASDRGPETETRASYRPKSLAAPIRLVSDNRL